MKTKCEHCLTPFRVDISCTGGPVETGPGLVVHTESRCREAIKAQRDEVRERVKDIADDLLGLQPADESTIALLDAVSKRAHEHRISETNAAAKLAEYEDGREPVDASWLQRQGGEWLGAARRWLQRHRRNGESVTWGSDDVLEPNMTVKDVEDLAADVAASTMRPQPTEARVEACLRARWKAERERDDALRWDDDMRDQWTAEIEAAFPTRSGAHEAYGDAMRMVGTRRSKGALVALVTWLIVRFDAKHADLVRVADKYREANARAERLRAAMEYLTTGELDRPGEVADFARAQLAALAQSADAPETSAKTSETERSDSVQQGSGASPVGPDVTRADLAPAEAPKSRDSHPLFKYDTNDDCSACAECKACGCTDCDAARDARECPYDQGRKDERARTPQRESVR